VRELVEVAASASDVLDAAELPGVLDRDVRECESIELRPFPNADLLKASVRDDLSGSRRRS